MQIGTLFQYEKQMINTNVPTPEIKLLAGADSIHDFDDAGGRVSLQSWGAVDSALKNALLNLNINTTSFGTQNTYTEWLAASSNKGITSSSAVEDQTILFYEKQYAKPLNALLKRTLTYRTVIDTINRQNKGDINVAIFEAYKELCGSYGSTCILDIDMEPEENWDTSYSTTDKVWIALFMLNYFFPPEVAATQTPEKYNTQLPSYITFDAGSNIPSKIFGRLDQVINLITPLNIADSAATGENHLIADGKKNQKRAGVKNKYAFPVNSANQYTYTSNVYTSSEYKLSIPSPADYNEKNKNQFQINITTPANSPISSIVFDAKHTVGPSVAYLSDTIAGGSYEPERNMADLRGLPKVPTLLLDLKRSGDWEQCSAAYTLNNIMASTVSGRVILCSIDRLCALYSRCIGQNTLWHCGTHLKLYRFPGKSLTAAQLQEIEAEKQRMAEKLATQMSEAVAAMKTAVRQTIVNLTAIIDDAYTPTPPRTISLPLVFKKGFGKNVVDTWLADVGIRQLFVVRSKLTALLDDAESAKIDNAVFFEQLSAVYGETIDYLNYKTYEAKIQSVSTLVKLNIPFFSYSLNVLKNVQSNLNVIQSFNPSQRVTKSFSANSAREEFAQRGFFTALTDIHNTTKAANLVEDKRYNLTYLYEIEYPEVKSGDDLTDVNKTYLGKLQSAMKTHFDNHQYTPSRPVEVAAANSPSGGGPTENIANLIQSIQYSLSDDFGRLCASISDIASHYYGVGGNQTGGENQTGEENQPGNNNIQPSTEMQVEGDQQQPVVEQSSSSKTIEVVEAAPVAAAQPTRIRKRSRDTTLEEPVVETDQTRVETENRNRIKTILTIQMTPEDKILVEKTIMDFLESCQYNLMSVYEWASTNDISLENNQEFAKVRLNYLYVYLFFSAMLTNPNVILSNLEETPEAVENIFENIANQNYPNPQIWPNSFIYKGLLGENSIYSEYCVHTQTGIHFKERTGFNAENIYLMVQQCIKIRYLGITNLDKTTTTVDPFNVVMAVFLFFQNYFKYIILKKIESQGPTDTDYSRYGYYPGFLEGFNRTDDAIVLLNILELLSDNGGINQTIPMDSITYESDQFNHIYTNFNNITFRLLLFIRDEKQSASAANALKKIKTGGNRKTLKRRSRRNKNYSNRRVRFPPRVLKTARRRTGRQKHSTQNHTRDTR